MSTNQPSLQGGLPDIQVARAIVQNDASDILLLQRRPEARNNPNLWEVPGGKVLGTSIIDGLHREIAEEASIEVELQPGFEFEDRYIIQDGDYAGRLYQARFYWAKLMRGSVELKPSRPGKRPEHVAWAWTPLDEAVQNSYVAPSTHRALCEFILRHS